MKYGIIYAMKKILILASLALASAAFAETVVNIVGVGAEKFTVSIQVANSDYSKCLAKNLELSGLFVVKPSGSIKISGASGSISASGRGKVITSPDVFSDAASARMAARRFSNALTEAFGKQKGFALDKILFLNRGKSSGKGNVRPSEMCLSYPDGFDVRQVTSDAKMSIYQRWLNDESRAFCQTSQGADKQ